MCDEQLVESLRIDVLNREHHIEDLEYEIRKLTERYEEKLNDLTETLVEAEKRADYYHGVLWELTELLEVADDDLGNVDLINELYGIAHAAAQKRF